MGEEEKKQQRIYNLLYTKTKPQKNSKIIGVSLWLSSSLDHNSFDYAILGISENKINATSHPNIGSLKTAIEEEWNKKSEKFILKACKSFWKKWWPYWVNLLFCIFLILLIIF